MRQLSLVMALALSACASQQAVQPDTTMVGDDNFHHAGFEKDRQAILAMAGEYKVTFQFEETVAMRPDYELAEPYTSGAYEFVEVVKDSGDEIVLQHILVVGEEDDLYVVKHWRQDWKYQDADIVEFEGFKTWKNVSLDPEAVKGSWTQAVYQVDDSPRYENYGHWDHTGNQSVWESAKTNRPLPRREYTVRDDYDVLVAINRHILTPDGWVHEQDNYKHDLSRDIEHPVIAREVGLNLYERIDGHDFSLGRDYWKKTGGFWADVRQEWERLLSSQESVSLLNEVDEQPLYRYMFDLAVNMTDDGSYQSSEGRREIRNVLDQFVIDKPQNELSQY